MTEKITGRLAPLQQQSAPLRNKIILALRSAIETGLLQPGARLVERDLCEQLNVSRTSLREALRELQAEGVLTHTDNRGLAVVVLSRDDAMNAYRLRAVVEALEGSLAPIAWLDDESCTGPGYSAQRGVWEEVRRATEQILTGVTIADLAERDRAAVSAPRYQI